MLCNRLANLGPQARPPKFSRRHTRRKKDSSTCVTYQQPCGRQRANQRPRPHRDLKHQHEHQQPSGNMATTLRPMPDRVLHHITCQTCDAGSNGTAKVIQLEDSLISRNSLLPKAANPSALSATKERWQMLAGRTTDQTREMAAGAFVPWPGDM